MDAEQHAPVEPRHTQAAREIAEAYLHGRYGAFATLEVLRAIETRGWEPQVAQALADEFEAGRKEAIEKIGEVLENCTPRRANG